MTYFKLKTNRLVWFSLAFNYHRDPEEHERTCSDGRRVSEVRIHLILARLPLALPWQAMDSAAYAERNQKPCQWAARHFETKCNARMNGRGGIMKKKKKN